jgi:hypothetical protein
VSDSSDDAGSDSEQPFERDRFDVERVADDPIDAFLDDPVDAALDDDPAGELADPGLSTPGADVDIDAGLLRMFWKLVLLYKFSLIGTTLGALLVAFEQGPNVGPELLAGGLAVLGYSLYLTRRAKARIDAGEFHDEPREEPTNTSADGGHPVDTDADSGGRHPTDSDADGQHPPDVGSTDGPGGVETTESPAADDSPEEDA